MSPHHDNGTGNNRTSAAWTRKRPTKRSPANTAASARQVAAVTLRFQGRAFQEIADELGYSGRAAAYKAVQRGLADLPPVEHRDSLRQLEAMRLDALQAAAWPAAMTGDSEGVRTVLKVMERRARLFGLDAPVKTEHRVTEELDAEIELMLAQLADRPPGHPG